MKNYKNGLEFIVNYIYKTQIIENSEEYIDINTIPDIDIENFDEIMKNNFNPYTIANILNYYVQTKGKDYVKDLFTKYKFNSQVIRNFCQQNPQNISLVPEELLKVGTCMDSLYDDIQQKETIDNPDPEIYEEYIEKEKEYYIGIRKFHESHGLQEMAKDYFGINLYNSEDIDNCIAKDFKRKYIDSEQHNYKENIDIMSLNYDNTDENIDNVLKYIHKDRLSQNLPGMYQGIDDVAHLEPLNIGITRIISPKGEIKIEVDSYTLAQICNYYITIKKGRTLAGRINKLPAKIIKYLFKLNKNAIIYTDLITYDEKIQWIISHEFEYSYDDLPRDMQDDDKIKKIYRLDTKEERNERYIKTIINNPKGYDYDSLPMEIAYDDRVKEAFHRTKQIYVCGINNDIDREGYNKNWINKQGELKKFFTIKQGDIEVKIESKEDYMKIIDAFLKSSLSIKRFCEKYSIVPEEGFNSFLDRVSEEDVEIGKVIKEKNQEKARNSFAMLRETTEKIYNSESTIEEMMQDRFAATITLDHMVESSLYLKGGNPKTMREIIAKELGDYIVNNEYRLDIENIKRFINIPTPDGKTYGMEYFRNLSQKIEELLKYNYPGTNKEKYVMAHTASAIIMGYAKSYDRDKLYSGIMVDGKVVEVTQDYVDQMLLFLSNNHIPRVLKTANYYLKAIVTGKLDYSVELEMDKNQKLEELDEMKKELDENTTVSEYMVMVDKKALI